jgi:glycosyltransferase involved in cell wall biosynthesis
MILALFPELLSKGGIQRISQDVCAVLQEQADLMGEPCHVFSLNDPKGVHDMEVAGCRYKVRGFAKSELSFVLALFAKITKCRLLYLGHPNFSALGLFCRALNSHLPYVVSAYGLEVWTPLSPFRRLGLRRASTVTSISRFTARKIVEVQGVDCEKVQVIPCVITEELLHANGNGGHLNEKRKGQKILLAVGRLDARERRKGMDEVILSLPRLLKSVPDISFVIAGDGDDRPRLEDLARKQGVTDSVTFKGVVTDDELVELYRNCDVFLMPSSQEGFGIVFLEAMAFRKPVIGGNHGGTPEVILDNETGFLVEHGDVNTLTDRISTLLHDPGLCQRMGDAGRQRVEEMFTFAPLRTRLLRLFSQLETP